jgi:hypothetical protein
MNFKSKVIELWKESGSPKWSFDDTLAACVETNKFFKTNNKNPAKAFRKAIDENNATYVRQWIMGCHFEWLNPR